MFSSRCGWLIAVLFSCVWAVPAWSQPVQSAPREFEAALTPTVTAGAYSSGQAIGGLQTISPFRFNGASIILNNESVWSQGGATTAITLYIFKIKPSTATTCNDNASFVLGAADVASLIASTPPVLTPAVVGAGTTKTTASAQLPVSITNGEGSTNLYICPVVGGAVTPATTTDLVFKYSGVQD